MRKRMMTILYSNKKDKVLLTGGAGFIGSHLAERYVQEGYETIVVDDLSTGSMEHLKNVLNMPNFHFHKVDITDRDALETIFKQYHPTIVNHHAAQKSVPSSIADPIHDLHINEVGLLNLLTLISEYPVQKFIFASSGGALGKEICGDERTKETDMPQFLSPYAITKYASENYIKLYAKLYGFEYTILRYANVYGTNQTMDGECGVVPIFIDNILHNRPSVLMTYEDMPRGCTRDYVYVDDLVDINLIVTEESANEVINIGTGKEIPILDIYYIIQRVFGSQMGIEIKGPREGDIKRSVLDTTRVEERYHWSAKVTLEEGIQKIHKSLFL